MNFNRCIAAVVPAIALVVAAAAPAFAQDEAPAGTGSNRIVVHIHGLRNGNGQMRCSLFASEHGFPEHYEHNAVNVTGRVNGRSGECVFDNVAPNGTYAVAVHHDENADGHMATNFIGIPLEGYGFSNDARPVMSAPSFHACQFHFAGGSMTVPVTAQY